MCSESERITFVPPLIIHLIYQVEPLSAFDLYFCITSLFLLATPLFHTLFSITSLSIPDLSNASCVSALLVFLLLNRSLDLQTFPSLPLTPFFFFSCLHSLIRSLPFLFASVSTPAQCTWFVIPPPPPIFVLLSHRPSRGQCGHHRRRAAAPAGGGGLPPRWVCQCLLPRLAGAAEPGRELHAHTGLRALWHR